MTRTRIEVPTGALSTPHFDDEATIITARPVVPIGRARVAEGSRLLLWFLPTILAASVFGALSALGVNYYENRQPNPVASTAELTVKPEPQTNQLPAAEPSPQVVESPSPEPAGVASPEVPEPPATEPEKTEPVVADQKADPAADKDRVIASSSRELAGLPVTRTAPEGTNHETNGTSNDTGGQVRKRRVLPENQNPPPESRSNKRNRGAGRILDIFEGPDRP